MTGPMIAVVAWMLLSLAGCALLERLARGTRRPARYAPPASLRQNRWSLIAEGMKAGSAKKWR